MYILRLTNPKMKSLRKFDLTMTIFCDNDLLKFGLTQKITETNEEV